MAHDIQAPQAGNACAQSDAGSSVAHDHQQKLLLLLHDAESQDAAERSNRSSSSSSKSRSRRSIEHSDSGVVKPAPHSLDSLEPTAATATATATSLHMALPGTRPYSSTATTTTTTTTSTSSSSSPSRPAALNLGVQHHPPAQTSPLRLDIPSTAPNQSDGLRATLATTSARDTAECEGSGGEHEELNEKGGTLVAPPTIEPVLVVSLSPSDTPKSPSTITINTDSIATIETSPSASIFPSKNSYAVPSRPKSKGRGSTPHEGKMLFGNRSAAGTAAHRRRAMANTNAITNYEADLTSQDRMTQKEAVKNLLAELVKNDWEWVWPPPDTPPADEPASPAEHLPGDSGLVAESVSQKPDFTKKTNPQEPASAAKDIPEGQDSASKSEHQGSILTPISPEDVPVEADSTSGDRSEVEDVRNQGLGELVWKERDEWLSNVSDNETESTTSPNSKSLFSPISPTSSKSPFRFHSPDGIGEQIQKTARERKRRYKKRQREDMAWNDGLRCFVERRDAWTGARHVPPPPRPLKRASISSGDGGSSTAVEGEIPDDEWEDDDTEIPIARPLIPPANPMRANITPEAYDTIFDKVVRSSLTPSCPINLKDITRSCVVGWKRDGTWEPPKPDPAAESPKSRRRRLSVAHLFSSADKLQQEAKKAKEREKEKEKELEREQLQEKEKKEKVNQGTIRKSIQKMKLLGKKD